MDARGIERATFREVDRAVGNLLRRSRITDGAFRQKQPGDGVTDSNKSGEASE